MRLRGLDLNLLLALDALLSLRSVTAAASRLHVSQPSMSGSLARLREHFGDPLLVAIGRKLELSPLGEMLLDPVREALEKVEQAIALRPDFDPATTKRHFSACASEATVLTLLTDVLRRAERLAPGVSVELLPAEPGPSGAMLHRRELDFVFASGTFTLPEHPHTRVINDSYDCVVWTGNRRVKKSLTLDQYLTMGHAVTRYGMEKRPSFEDYQLQMLGIRRREEVSCPTPALLGPLVVGTQRIATMPARLAQLHAAVMPLRVFKPPVDLEPLQIEMYWHRTRDHDAATQWLRGLIVEVATEHGFLDPQREASAV
ncbi:MAG: LysR family transcriptional regulator [Variovorax sp.]|nr:MAG: LysR family transcriptional regulator [Variovorax sp.]